jgi:hypothetical protein
MAVRLDQWQNIVNVHWGSITHIAFRMSFRITGETGAQSGIGLPELPSEQQAYNYLYLTSSEYAHSNPLTPIMSPNFMGGAGIWFPLTLAQLSVAGAPDPAEGSFGYGAFSKAAGSLARAFDGTLFGMSGPDVRLQAGGGVGGEDLEINPPGGSTSFKSGSTFTIEHRGDTYSGSPEYGRSIGGERRAWAPCSGVFSPTPLLSNASRYSAHSFDFAGITAAIGDVEYEFAGLLARESVAIGAGHNSAININVLLARV